ncbi:MAG: 50S ribosomal protein L31 [Balneolaceae bacterium]
MKKGIHPDYKEITVMMSDGTEVKTRSTMNAKDGVYRSEVDSKNHPFYTKSNTFTSADGRIDRFKRMYGNKK